MTGAINKKYCAPPENRKTHNKNSFTSKLFQRHGNESPE
jgi:hypothetical protein